jgi:hypothetical protein
VSKQIGTWANGYINGVIRWIAYRDPVTGGQTFPRMALIDPHAGTYAGPLEADARTEPGVETDSGQLDFGTELRS